MRIVIAVSNGSVVGGAENHLSALIPALSSGGHSVAVFHETPASPNGMLTASGEDSCWCVAELGTARAIECLEAWNPDLVYVHGLANPSLEDALTERYPAVLYAHNYYGTCGTGTKCHAWPSVRPCGRTLGPMCLALHYPRRCGGLNPARFWREYRLQSRRRSFFARYRAVIVASRHMHAEYRHHGVAEDRLHHVAPFPVATVPDVEVPARHPWTNRVLMMGRLTRLKGGAVLIDALAWAARALGRKLQLVVTGDGPERVSWQRQAKQCGLDADFLGWVDTGKLDELRRSSDLLGIPSLWPEPFGLIGIEAGCAGLPAVGFATGGIPDWLVPGETGESGPGNPPRAADLADAIVRALQDPIHHHRLRVGAWRMAQQFTPARHLSLLGPILEAACRG